MNESIGSSITAVSNVTLNGNHVESESGDETTLIELDERSHSFNSVTTSQTDSFADTILTIKDKQNISDVGCIIEPLIDNLASISLESTAAVLSLQSTAEISFEHDVSVPRVVSNLCEERESFSTHLSRYDTSYYSHCCSHLLSREPCDLNV